MAAKFQHILEPGYIGSVRTRNRMLKTGASIGFFPSADGTVPQVLMDYYEELAKGGAGIVVFAGGPIEYPRSQGSVPGGGGYRFDDDKFIPSLNKVAKIINKHGCPAFFQVFAGRVGASTFSKSEMPVARFDPVRELAVSEIEELVQMFGDVAERVHKAGFQGLELNGGCNHLLNSFLSRFWNKRQDAYGCGSLESRAKIVVDIIREIKRRNGKDFAVISLINGAEPRLPNGITSEESRELAKIIQAAGADAINVRVEYYPAFTDPANRDSTHFPDIALYPEIPSPLGAKIDTSHHGAGGWAPLAAAIKKNISIPVIAPGRMDAEIGERIIKDGLVDFISMNRRLMADHDYPRKIAEGKPEEIRPCTGCFTCFDVNERHLDIVCQVNAALCKEREYEIKPTARKKKVMIIGGGPAGLETAKVAALRGHQVILFDKEKQLGGSILVATIVKGFGREDFLSLIRYYKLQMKKIGVDVRLGKEVTRSVVEEIKPDVLVVAAGGTHNIPEIPGIKKRKVVNGQTLHKQLKSYLNILSPRTIYSLTKLWMPVGKNVVVIGGNIQGCQVAAMLVKRNRKVTIVETSDTIGEGLLEIMVKPLLLEWLARKGTTMLAGVKYEEVTNKGLVVTTKSGNRMTIETDTILTALPLLPNSKFIKSLEGVVPEIHAVGDCADPGLIVNAIAEGSRIGREI